MNRRCWLVSVAMIGAVTLSACHYNPYRYPRPGEAAATTLENQLKERDSLQDAAKDMIAVGAAIRDAVQRVYSDTQWAPTSDGAQANCAPPYVFLSGTVYVLPRWQSPAPVARQDAQALVTAVAGVLKAHHADKVDTNKIDPAQGPSVGQAQSVSGVLPREHGELRFVISVPVTRDQPPTMALSGTTGCHHAKAGPGPWDTPPPRPAPPPGNGPPEPPPGNGPGPPAPPSGNGPGPPAPPS